MPETLMAQLAVGGTMVIPVGDRTSEQYVVRVRRTGEADYQSEQLWPVRFVPLVSEKNGDS
jgi:protein-L-isoaspartate(D-aspartate) O-methyltransferase